eukprot:SAG31_NODE_303_length_18065_cov_5.733107_16_plen_67_part_00
METVWKQVVGIQEASSNSNEEAKSLQEQIQEIKQLQMNGSARWPDILWELVPSIVILCSRVLCIAA